MIGEAVKEALQKIISVDNILYMEPMSRHTTFRVGGNATCFVKISDFSELPHLLHYLSMLQIPYFIMGNGSNLLVSDKGYDGIVIQISDTFSDIRVEGCHLYAQAGASMAKAAKTAYEHGLKGLEFAAGIPGTVGGGAVMNAGAYDGEMKQVIESVTVLDQQGNELILDNSTMEFGYRTSAIRYNSFIVTECCFLLEEGDKGEISAKMEDFQKRRREKQPLEYPSAGSTFKRPEGYFAGKLISDAGLKGLKIGGAQVSEKHAGFIINADHATATDISRLITQVQQEVYNRFTVHLEPEVVFLGDF